MISKLSAKYQFCSTRTADTRDGKLTTRGVCPWFVHRLSIVYTRPCCFKFRTVHCCWALPGIWDKSSDVKIGQWGRPWLVWYVPCKRRCVPRFTKLKHRHRHHKWHNDRRWRQWRCVSPGPGACEKTHSTVSVGTRSVTVSRWTARRYFHCLRRTITRITDKIMTVKCVTTIPCIDPADLSINISD